MVLVGRILQVAFAEQNRDIPRKYFQVSMHLCFQNSYKKFTHRVPYAVGR